MSEQTAEEVHVCEEEGCTSTDVTAVYLEPSDGPDGYYCDKHIALAGFCKGCGQFCAGIESFDFSEFPGFCDNCADQIRHEYALEAGEFDDDEDDDLDDLPFDDEDELDWENNDEDEQ